MSDACPSPSRTWPPSSTSGSTGHAAAELLGVPVSRVRTMIREHELAAAVPVPGAGQQMPAGFIQDGLVVKGLPGLLTVLHDGGYDDRECIAWLFLDDDLPGPADRRAAREPRRRGQAPRPGDGLLSWRTDESIVERIATMSGLAALLAAPQGAGHLPVARRLQGRGRAAHRRARRLALRPHRRLARRDQGRLPARGRRGAGLPRRTTARTSTPWPTASATSSPATARLVLLWDGWGPLARHDERAFSVALSVLGGRVNADRGGPFAVRPARRRPRPARRAESSTDAVRLRRRGRWPLTASSPQHLSRAGSRTADASSAASAQRRPARR